MSYLVFARKFRPQTFEELVGQAPIATTLKNAIRQKRIPQNFLFAGPRGIGKTSTARILAKALNCTDGPAETPCGKCAACVEITQSNSLDVLEIDGASNRGIDEIRNLRETVKFKPVTGRYKIYIIDEVHMLTPEAFNALLKTLEEPPPHVKFIFATTESYKVPLTILSRCQRFNFKRISAAEIAAKLAEIAGGEKIKFEKKALYLIAKASDGALRDAEMLLDQLASFVDGEIKEEDVLEMLGLASEEVYFSTLAALREKDAKKIFAIVADLYDGGRDLVQFAKGLFEIFRHLFFLQCLGNTGENPAEFIELSEDAIKELEKRKNDFSRGELLLALSLLENLQGPLRRNLAPPRLLVETVLLKLMHLDGLRAVEALIPGAGNKIPEPPARSREINAPPPSRPAESRSPQPDEPENFQPSNPSSLTTVDSPGAHADIAEAWPRVIDYVKAKRMSTGIFLSESEPVETSAATVTLGLPAEFQFHKEMLEKASNRELIEEAIEVVCAKKWRVKFVVTQRGSEIRKRPADPDPAPAEVTAEGKLPDIIAQALNIFDGAKIIRKE